MTRGESADFLLVSVFTVGAQIDRRRYSERHSRLEYSISNWSMAYCMCTLFWNIGGVIVNDHVPTMSGIRRTCFSIWIGSISHKYSQIMFIRVVQTHVLGDVDVPREHMISSTTVCHGTESVLPIEAEGER